MKTAKYKTKTGNTQFKPVLSQRELQNVMMDGTEGFCLACGSEASGVEPDARKYTCESCGNPKVYGFEELLMMNLIA